MIQYVRGQTLTNCFVDYPLGYRDIKGIKLKSCVISLIEKFSTEHVLTLKDTLRTLSFECGGGSKLKECTWNHNIVVDGWILMESGSFINTIKIELAESRIVGISVSQTYITQEGKTVTQFASDFSLPGSHAGLLVH